MSYHSYYSSSELSSSSNVRLAPQTTARIAREVRELIVKPESGVYLVVDEATGLPHSLQELTVRSWLLDTCVAAETQRVNRFLFFPCVW